MREESKTYGSRWCRPTPGWSQNCTSCMLESTTLTAYTTNTRTGSLYIASTNTTAIAIIIHRFNPSSTTQRIDRGSTGSGGQLTPPPHTFSSAGSINVVWPHFFMHKSMVVSRFMETYHVITAAHYLKHPDGWKLHDIWSVGSQQNH